MTVTRIQYRGVIAPIVAKLNTRAQTQLVSIQTEAKKAYKSGKWEKTEFSLRFLLTALTL